MTLYSLANLSASSFFLFWLIYQMLSLAVFESLMLLVTLHSVSPLAAVVTTGMIHQVDEAPNHIPNKTLLLSSC